MTILHTLASYLKSARDAVHLALYPHHMIAVDTRTPAQRFLATAATIRNA